MLIAIVGLALIVVFLANKAPDTGQSGAPLPDPHNIPATGTTGVPSPATMMNPMLSTNRGMLALVTNARDVVQRVSDRVAPVDLPPTVVTNAPQGPPDQSKSLSTQQAAPLVRFLPNLPAGKYEKI